MRKSPDKYSLILILAAYAITFAPFIVFPLFPSQDGPSHVNSAFALAYLDKGDPFFSSYFTRIPVQFTNWIAGAILSAFIQIIPVNHVEMLFVFLYACLLMASVALSLKFCFKVDARLSFFFLPFVFSQMIHMGSFNFCLAYAFFPLLMGTCYLYLQSPSNIKIVAATAILMLIYCIHIQIAAIGAGFVLIFALWPFIVNLAAKTLPAQHTAAWKKLGLPPISEGLKLALACLPIIIAAAFFMTNNSEIVNNLSYSGFVKRVLHLLFLRGMATYSVFGLFVAFLMACALLSSIYIVARHVFHSYKPTSIDPCLFGALGLAALLLVIPEGIGDVQDIEDRIMIPTLMALLFWLLVRKEDLWLKPTTILLMFVLIAGQGIDRFVAWSNINKNLREFSEAVTAIPEKQAIYSMDFDAISDCTNQKSPTEPFKTHTRFLPYFHFLGYAIGNRSIAEVDNYEANFRNQYFPLKLSEEFRKIIGDGDLEFVRSKENPGQKIDAFVSRLKNEEARPVSYLITWRSFPSCPLTSVETEIMDTVNKAYDLVFSSSNKKANLYKMKK